MAEGNISVEENIGLVHTCAKRFKGRGIEYDDLFQAGCMGLVKAAGNFNSELGYKFSTYAVPVIIGEIKRLFRDGGAVKLSRSLKETSLKVTREAESFCKETGREPTVSELAERLNMSSEQVTEALSASLPPVSLTMTDEDGDIQTDIPTESPEERITERLSLEQELQKLDERDKQLIILRFFRGMTQTEAAARLSMTQVQVSRLEKKLLLYLKQNLSGSGA